jgi:hypothetical protein
MHPEMELRNADDYYTVYSNHLQLFQYENDRGES